MYRHATDLVALIAGTVFAGFTAVWVLTESDVLDIKEAWLAGPGILILAGIVGLAVALTPSRERPPAYAAASTATTGPDPEQASALSYVDEEPTDVVPLDDDEPTDVVPLDDDEPTDVVPLDDEPTDVLPLDDDEPTDVLPLDDEADRRE